MLAIKCREMTTILKLYSVVANWLLPKKYINDKPWLNYVNSELMIEVKTQLRTTQSI